MNLTIQHNERMRVIARVLAALALAGASGWTHAALEPDQSRVVPPSGDGWQILSAAATPAGANGRTAHVEPTAPGATASAASVASAASAASVAPAATTGPTPIAVTSVVLPGAPSTPAGVLTLSVSPQDLNLRNALDRWLQTQGWQLAWKVDDDLPLEFNATFSGDFTSVLTQVMQATNHMRVPTRICRHTNNVIRVVARAANCQE
ncbi:pilus assembly protein [Paraburkholderia panacisoli]|uniref:Pilus assembly protein n=1 Tax=Paraburkholderia panacisoli TaxID=2603818 RepID=A0A5B0GLJ4_9BURK|nr:toxin co-regulated pilus biosynthesis Q family protein [Paraburkholderia panacisoli]KAA1004344.1 pilus assembly protein [Paraburkholderia panacisoli]